MSSSPAIRLWKVSKKYPIYDTPSQKLAEMLTLRRRSFHREFWALEEIDLEVEKGTTLGIIGQNGSGKSTLLQIIAGILRQSRGECVVDGSVAALLELGAGFNPEFSGRENVFMNGAINGIPQEVMRERFDDILAFAEIGEFIDQPVKTYSSGMFVRLAFAVAIHVDPDILLVDEALAVGDMIFQHRCINRIRRLKREGKTILFVTHDLQAVSQFCDRAILLDQGKKRVDSSPEEVVHAYHALVPRGVWPRICEPVSSSRCWSACSSKSLLSTR
ncbi:MAG: ABC transporter ATP-binding protein [Acidobacteriota bacterium]